MKISSIKTAILLGVLTGWIFYMIMVSISQGILESKIKSVKIFDKLFNNDPALFAAVKHSIESGTYSEVKHEKYGSTNYNIMTWRIAQNLEIISQDDRPDQLSDFINHSLGSIVENKSINEVRELTGLQLVYEILSRTGKKHQQDSVNLEVTVDYLAACMAGTPMALREYVYHIQFNGNLGVFFSKLWAYLIPPEISSGTWSETTMNEITSLAYKHIGVADEFQNIDVRDGKLERIVAYQQYNDLILKLLIMVYNDEAVVGARDRLMVFKGLVQCLILMTFFVTLFVVLFLNITDKKVARALDLLKTMLPTLGFIGTILGLMRSLGDAYKIPIASGNANTSLAISEITSSLSIAFTTTLLAFVLLIIIDIVRVYKLKNQV